MFNKTLWKHRFHLTDIPNWSCPTCNVGTLQLIPKSVIEHEKAPSILARKECDGWEPDWFEGSFIALLKCTNKNCAETVSFCGASNYDLDYDPKIGDQALVQIIIPKWFEPQFKMFVPCKQCPEKIVDQLLLSFSLYYADQNSAGNRLRACVETLLDLCKIPRKRRKSNGKYYDLKAHERIQTFISKIDADIGHKLMALKWLGNLGSHTDVLDQDSLLNAYEIFDHVIEEYFGKRTKKLNQLVGAINKSKGKPKKSKSV